MFKVLFRCLYLVHKIILITADPLFLTPFIENGKIDDARRAAAVKPFLPNVTSYSGYLTVSKVHQSNLFFWFFTTNQNWTHAPLVLWLNGGPGATSMFGLFTENGPYVFKKGKLQLREHTWTRFYNVLYVDNPVGVGFSFTESEKGYATNQRHVGENLHEALRQFLLLFPEMQKNKIILSGESYAGKYLPALAYTILKKNGTVPSIKIYGIFVGNPLIMPEHMLTRYHEYFYWHGLLDKTGKGLMLEREEQILAFIKSKKWSEAGDLYANTFFEAFIEGDSLFQFLTGIRNHYHLMKDTMPRNEYGQFLNQSSTKEALHARQRPFNHFSWTVYERLKPDIMKPMSPYFEEVIEHYRTVIYSGQLDIVCPYYAQEAVLKNLNWSAAWEYHNATRKVFRWKQYLCGYYKTAKTLTNVMIRNAGHFAPTDKPQWVLALLKKFVNGDFETSLN